MTEADFRQQAERSDGIACTFYPARRPLQQSIVRVDEPVRIAGHLLDPVRWTDGGSIPWFVRWIASPLGYLFRAYLLHDVLLFDGYGWAYANRKLAEAMNELDAPLWQRVAVLEAVRANARWQRFKARMGWEAMYVGKRETHT